MRRGFAQIITAVSLIFALGGHWAILQSLAWAGMIVTYSQKETVSQAISKTFDGKHPCSICKLVRHGTQKEQKQQTIKTKFQLDPMLEPELAAADPIIPFPLCGSPDLSVPVRPHLPALPPPRQA